MSRSRSGSCNLLAPRLSSDVSVLTLSARPSAQLRGSRDVPHSSSLWAFVIGPTSVAIADLAMRLSSTRLGAVEAKAGRRLITPQRLGRSGGSLEHDYVERNQEGCDKSND